MAGVCFLPPVVDFLAEEPPFWGVSFLPADLEGVYLRTFSTVLSVDFLPATFLVLAADFEAALAAAFPPLTFGTAA